MIMVDELVRHPQAKLACFRPGACHLTVDGTSPEHIEALHDFAAKIGMRRAWYQPKSSPHYDLVKAKRDKALAAGAVFVGAIDQARARMARRALDLKLAGDCQFCGGDGLELRIEFDEAICRSCSDEQAAERAECADREDRWIPWYIDDTGRP